MVADTIIGFDSNVLSAFLLGNNGQVARDRGDPLAQERMATYRLFLHCNPCILPSVTAEAGLIPDGMKLEEHLRFMALLHESSRARTMPTDRLLTCRCDTTLVGRGRSSDSGSHSRGRPHSPAQLDSGREDHRR